MRINKSRFLILLFLTTSFFGLKAQDLPPQPVEERNKFTIYDVWESKPLDLKGYIPEVKEFVPTFASISYYYPAGTNDTECKVYFRKLDSDNWERAFTTVFQKEYSNFRGSIVNLTENTSYVLKAEFFDNSSLLRYEIDTVKTWREQLQIAKTYSIHDFASNNYVINVSGKQGAWIRIVGDNNSVDGGFSRTAAIKVENQHFLVFENIIVTGGYNHGIDVNNSSNIRIVNCDISGWGRIGRHIYRPEGEGKYYDSTGTSINRDAGIRLQSNQMVVVERCYIHDPRGRANPWYYAHPEGPNAICVGSVGTDGNYVIRYNDFVGSDLHRWNDVVEGYENGSPEGSVYRDSDIYGNFFSLGNDDGIELDGGQMNVRVFGNKFVQSLCGISTAPNMIGPSYLFRNVITDLYDETGRAGVVIKNGGGRKYSSGLAVFMNNTFVAECPGIRSVGMGRDADRGAFTGFSRNNIIVSNGKGNSPVSDSYGYTGHDMDYDLLWNSYDESGTDLGSTTNSRFLGRVRVDGYAGLEVNAIVADPQFVSAENHRFDLKENSPAINSALPVDNFQPEGKKLLNDKGAYDFGSPGLIPWRPIPVFVNKNRIILQEDFTNKRNNETVTFHCNGLEPGSRNFYVRINKAYPWLKVEPLTGTLPVIGDFEFKVYIDKKAFPFSFYSDGAFIIKLENGYSVPVMVNAKLAGGKSHSVSWKIPVNLKKDQVVSANLEIPEAGMYYIYLKAAGSISGNAEARYFLWMNQQTRTDDRYANAQNLSNKPAWIHGQLSSNNNRNATVIYIDKGINKFDLQLLDEMNIQEILISTDPFLVESPDQKISKTLNY